MIDIPKGEIFAIPDSEATQTKHKKCLHGFVEQLGAGLQIVCHQAAVDAGRWREPYGAEKLIAQNPYYFSSKLLLIISELAKYMVVDRENLWDDKIPTRKMREVELADAVIRIFDLAGAFDMDLGGAIAEKMAYNVTRPDHELQARQAAGGKTY